MTTHDAIKHLSHKIAFAKECDTTYAGGIHIEALEIAVRAMAEGRIKGEWIPIGEVDQDGNQYYNCSLCQCGETHNPRIVVSFCWNCGADMRKEKTDAEIH